MRAGRWERRGMSGRLRLGCDPAARQWNPQEHFLVGGEGVCSQGPPHGGWRAARASTETPRPWVPVSGFPFRSQMAFLHLTQKARVTCTVPETTSPLVQ